MLKLHDSRADNLSQFIQSPECDEYKAIMLTLNTYEFVAAGIRTNALREGTYKRLRYSQVIRDWEALRGFVFEFRRKKERYTLFQEFEWLYGEWKKKPLK